MTNAIYHPWLSNYQNYGRCFKFLFPPLANVIPHPRLKLIQFLSWFKFLFTPLANVIPHPRLLNYWNFRRGFEFSLPQCLYVCPFVVFFIFRVSALPLTFIAVERRVTGSAAPLHDLWPRAGRNFIPATRLPKCRIAYVEHMQRKLLRIYTTAISTSLTSAD